MKLSARIFAGFIAIVLIFATALAFSLTRIERIRDDLSRVQRGYVKLARHATQLRTLQEARDEYVSRARAETSQKLRRHLVRYATEYYPRATRVRLNELHRLVRDLDQSATSDADRAFVQDVQKRLRRIDEARAIHDDTTARLLESAAVEPLEPPEPPEGDPLEADKPPPPADALLDEYEAAHFSLSREVRALSLAAESKVGDALLRAEAGGRDAAFASISLSVVALFIGLGVLFLLQRALAPLRDLLESIRRIRRGDLDVEVPTEGKHEVAELAREFNAMIRGLKDREGVVQQRGEELLALKAFSDDVIRSVRVGVLILDESGAVQGLNPAARSVFGLPLVDLEGRDLAELEELAAGLLEVIARVPEVLKSGELLQFEQLQLGDKLVDAALVPVRDRTGAARDNVLLLGEDVTVREKTRVKLVESERLAAIGRLAAQITHEIRNPLSSVALNIELLGDDVEHLPDARQDEARSILAAVAGEVDRLTEITEGYLRYARLPAPKTSLGDVGDLLADLAAFSQGEATQADVMLELRVDDDLPEVPHDRPRLRQAFLNLLRNALEAAGRGGTVRLVATSDDTGAVVVRVEDSGPGVPDDVRERLFEPFFTTKDHGTGLGLTLTQEIVDDHSGQLELDTSDLGGAAFRIRLPPEPAVESTAAE
jgi:signal transduction histidine kinase